MVDSNYQNIMPRWLLITIIFASPLAVRGQVIQRQTVQLPTFHYFGVSTTVVVPTHGTIPLGGVTYGGIVPTPFDRVGPSYGIMRESVGLQIGATVIDNDELDRAVLAEAARQRGAAFDVLGRPVAPRLQPADRADAQVYLRRARDAEATGQPEVAKVFYRRAAKLGSVEAEARLAQRDQR
jgi:hypothetical protein